MERVILDRAEVLSLIDVSRSCGEKVHVLHSEWKRHCPVLQGFHDSLRVAK